MMTLVLQRQFEVSSGLDFCQFPGCSGHDQTRLTADGTDWWWCRVTLTFLSLARQSGPDRGGGTTAANQPSFQPTHQEYKKNNQVIVIRVHFADHNI